VGISLDVTDPTSVSRCFGEIQRLGPVELVMNNAGVGSTSTVPELALEEWEHVFAVNARGTFLCSKAVLP